jgi:hypothetical protein
VTSEEEAIRSLFALFEAVRRNIVELGMRAAAVDGTLDFALILRINGEDVPFWRVMRSLHDREDLLAFLDAARAGIDLWDMDPNHRELPTESFG